MPRIPTLRDIPLSERERFRCDRHAATQQRHRKKLADLSAPDREDFGRAALACALGLYSRDPKDRRAEALRRGIFEVLTTMRFDRQQMARRYDDMADRVLRDLAAWERKRLFDLQRRSQLDQGFASRT
jgi:hypothetical protein